MIYFTSMSDFWAMGGYGFYVWLSFGLGFLSMLLLWLGSLATKKKLFAKIKAEQQRQQRIKQAKTNQSPQSRS